MKNKSKSFAIYYFTSFLILCSAFSLIYAFISGGLDFSQSELSLAIESEKNAQQLQDDQIKTFTNDNFSEVIFDYNTKKVEVRTRSIKNTTFDGVNDLEIEIVSKENTNSKALISIRTLNNTSFTPTAHCGFVESRLDNGFSRIKTSMYNKTSEQFELKQYYIPDSYIRSIDIEKEKNEIYQELDFKKDTIISIDDMTVCIEDIAYTIDSSNNSNEKQTYGYVSLQNPTKDIDEVFETIEGLEFEKRN